jgi:hypothetical protein
MTHHRRKFPYVLRAQEFRLQVADAPKPVRDSLASVVRRLQNADTEDLRLLPHRDPKYGDALTVALPGCDGLLAFQEMADMPALKLIMLMWADD